MIKKFNRIISSSTSDHFYETFKLILELIEVNFDLGQITFFSDPKLNFDGIYEESLIFVKT